MIQRMHSPYFMSFTLVLWIHTGIVQSFNAQAAETGKAATRAQKDDLKVEESLDISTVPAGFPVGFCLLTQGHRQYVAYYDAKRRMTVASRTLKENKWQYQVLPSKIGWDSHNYITMTIDDEGYLHLSGNMHCVPLIYFRTTKPWDITTFERNRVCLDCTSSLHIKNL